MKKSKKYKSDTDLTADDLKKLCEQFKKKVQGGPRPRVPRRSRGAALGRRRRGVQELGRPPGRLLPQDRRHSRRVGHRLQRAEHGLRQPGRHLGHRRGLLAQPGHRREQVLRRVARQRPGRRRGGRHPHAQPVERSDQEPAEPAPALAANRVARAVQATRRHPQQAGAALPRHAGHRVHDPGRQALHAPVPQRQADRHRGLEHGHGHARRRADRREDGRDARASRRSSTSCCTRSSIRPPRRRPRRSCRGLPAGPGGAVRQDRLHLGRRRRMRPSRARR